jgi:hypothetical protein
MLGAWTMLVPWFALGAGRVLAHLAGPAQPFRLNQFMATINPMAKSSTSARKKRPGRPATGHDPQYAVRLSKQIVAAIDKIAKETDTGRATVMRQLIIEALEARKRS